MAPKLFVFFFCIIFKPLKMSAKAELNISQVI